jgi:hypothetical protein
LPDDLRGVEASARIDRVFRNDEAEISLCAGTRPKIVAKLDAAEIGTGGYEGLAILAWDARKSGAHRPGLVKVIERSHARPLGLASHL